MTQEQEVIQAQSSLTNITATTAVSGGIITSDGGLPVTSRGVCWDTNHNPTILNSKTTDGSGTGSYISTINGLSAHTIYYIRAYATNSAGTTYGSELSFQTLGASGAIIFNPNLTYGSMTDIDGNVYKTIQIGTQTWMAENLKTTRYRNGDPISNVTSFSGTTGAYIWYNNEIANKFIYGALYNKYAVEDSRNIAPAGWHVCTYNDVLKLVNYLGGPFVAGGKLRETGTTHWQSPNAGTTNESGFTALPGGEGDGSSYQYLEKFGIWWYSNQPQSPGNWSLSSIADGVAFDYNSNLGFSVRCVKD